MNNQIMLQSAKQIGAGLATLVYFWLGLKFISKTWFNLDAVWAVSLILVGAIGFFTAFNT